MSFYPSRPFLYLLGVGCVLAGTPIFLPVTGTVLSVTYLLILFGAVVLDGVLTRRMDAGDVRVEVPDELGVGQSGTIELTLSQDNDVPVRTQLLLRVPSSLSVDQTFWDRDLPAGESVTLSSTVRARTRERAEIGPLQLRHRGVLSLLVFRSSRETAGEIDVIPDIREIRNQELRIPQIIELLTGQKAHEKRAQDGEFDSLVEYEPGMDPRKIDWKASARHYRMLSRQHRIEQNHSVYFMMDAGRLMGTRLNDVRKLDWAINAALRLSFLALNVGDRVGMMGFARDVLRVERPDDGMSQFQRLLEAMNDLSTQDRESNFMRAFRVFSRMQRERSLVVVFTDFVDRVSASLLLEALSLVRKRHVVLFVACRDVALQASLLEEPEDLMDVHRQNESYRLLNERDEVIREIQRMGITTLDEDVSTVTPKLINQYLTLKSRQRV